MNTLLIDGYKAVIEYDPDIQMYRGAFQGLNGGADFYADTEAELQQEGRISLNVFLDGCKKAGINPLR